MAREERSVRAREGVSVQRCECAWCGLAWNRLPKPGPVPRFCSDACKQANWRDGKRGRDVRGQRVRVRSVAYFHAELERITAATPLPWERAVPLLRELAGAVEADETPIARLYKSAATTWHPDRPNGDHRVFQLLQEVFRLARKHAP